MLSLEDESNYARDPYSKALINIDSKGYNDYMRAREQSKKIHELEQKISNIGSDITSIKNMLTNLIDKNNG